MKNLTTTLLLFCSITVFAQNHAFDVPAEESLEDVFNLKWTTWVGLTTFRTNIIYEGGKIFIGSNGIARGDEGDKSDGVYIIDAKTGKTIKQLLPKKAKGDHDVCGVAVADDKLYYGDDAGYFYCYNLDGKLLWKQDLNPESPDNCYLEYSGETIVQPNDIESAPALADFDQDGYKDVVVVTEGGYFYLLNGVTGKIIWERSENIYDNYHYAIGSPALFDFNKDSIPEVLFGCRLKNTVCSPITDGSFFILDGKTGNTLQSFVLSTGISSATKVYVTKSDTTITCAGAYSSIFQFKYGRSTYQLNSTKLPEDWVKGFFGTPFMTREGAFCIGSSWWGGIDDGVHFWNDDLKIERFYQAGRTSATVIEADILSLGHSQLLVPTEGGELFILHPTTGELIKRLNIQYEADWKEKSIKKGLKEGQLKAGAEASVFVADIDEDGLLELLVASLDGFLYCYDTKSKAGATQQSQFLENNSNTGVIDYR